MIKTLITVINLKEFPFVTLEVWANGNTGTETVLLHIIYNFKNLNHIPS